jgi:formamidopyrimidine-DNA glycosylase
VPELPEVEVVRRGLARWVSGRVVAQVQVLHPRAVRRHVLGAAEFASRLAGHRLGEATRRGKYLWLPLHDPDDDPAAPTAATEALVAHLGMSGQLLVVEPGAPDETHLRVRVSFADAGPALRFVDQRTFGGLALDALHDGVPVSVAHIARDPLDPDFDEADFVRALRSRRSELKRALLDQTLVSGIGNIYADESLWRARLHWSRPAASLTPAQVRLLLASVREVLAEALAAGGTSFDSLYVNVNGASGWFDRSLAVYGRAGRPCPRCGSPVRREPFMNRSSYSCPRCQPRPRRPRGGP